jgi:hypothetical protein
VPGAGAAALQSQLWAPSRRLSPVTVTPSQTSLGGVSDRHRRGRPPSEHRCRARCGKRCQGQARLRLAMYGWAHVAARRSFAPPRDPTWW